MASRFVERLKSFFGGPPAQEHDHPHDHPHGDAAHSHDETHSHPPAEPGTEGDHVDEPR